MGLGGIDGTARLVARLMYGTGMRVVEAVRLRILDLDFAYRQIVVRAGLVCMTSSHCPWVTSVRPIHRGF